MKSRVTRFTIVALGMLVLGLSLGRPFYDSDTSDGSDSEDGDTDYAMVVHPAPVFNS